MLGEGEMPSLSLTSISSPIYVGMCVKPYEQVVLGGEERPALVLEGPPALTQPARYLSILILVSVFCPYFQGFLLFSSYFCFILELK